MFVSERAPVTLWQWKDGAPFLCEWLTNTVSFRIVHDATGRIHSPYSQCHGCCYCSASQQLSRTGSLDQPTASYAFERDVKCRVNKTVNKHTSCNVGYDTTRCLNLKKKHVQMILDRHSQISEDNRILCTVISPWFIYLFLFIMNIL